MNFLLTLVFLAAPWGPVSAGPTASPATAPGTVTVSGSFHAMEALASLASDPAVDPSTAGDTLTAEDAWLDPGVRTLVERARRVRGRTAEGVERYQATVWERVEVGLTGNRFRRERTAFTDERRARVAWEAPGNRVVRWEGARQAIPMAGVRSEDDSGMAESLARTLGSMTGGSSPVFNAPGDDRIFFGGWGGDDWGLHPLADTAHHAYRYGSGDTLRVTLPGESRSLELVEVRVEPRRMDPRLVVGSLWFDLATGDLVRGTYRPARPIVLVEDLPDSPGAEGTRVPLLLRTIQLEVRQVTADYTLQEMTWWLPHRYAISLELRFGEFLRFPVVVQWQVDDYRVNGDEGEWGRLAEVPEAWVRAETLRPSRAPGASDGDSVSVVTLVPPADLLGQGLVGVPAGGAGTELGAPAPPRPFTAEELEAFRQDLEGILPRVEIFAPRVTWGLGDGLLRYNRVEGVSPGVALVAPLVPGWSIRTEARLGSADPVPLGSVRVRRGAGDRSLDLALHHSLAHGSDWDDPLGLSASLATLLAGVDAGEYHRVSGLEAGLHRRGRSGAIRAMAFAERHRSAEKNTDFSMRRWVGGDTLRTNREALHGAWVGLRVTADGHRGREMAGGRAFGRVTLEAATGETAYSRLGLSGGVIHPLGPVELGMELGAGRGWGDLPPQREFQLGGPRSVRGIRHGSLVGPAHGFARVEVARPARGARLALFGDAGWAGSTDRIRWDETVRSAGLGISVLDGLIRMDLARALHGADGWRIHVYLDGIL
ncbi:MAG: hypothetical protein EA422_05675 [Gemmatimonadales bacterium]|nr:MAG: hypothetical protein EA422_05675 [Gemmatimonadales bacterium]